MTELTTREHYMSLLRRLIAALVTALVISAPIALIQATPASAALSSPGNGAIVRGSAIFINEASGGADNCAFGNNGDNTRLEVLRNGSIIAAWEKGDGGSFGVNWNSIGQPNGALRIKSFGRNISNGFFSCNTSGWNLLSDIGVTLDNRSFVTINAAGSGFANEAVAITGVVTNEFNQALGGRNVSLSVDGVGGSVNAVTNGSGVYSANVPVNRPSGGTTLRVSHGGSLFDSASSASRGFTVLTRPTTLSYIGAGSAQSGDTFFATTQLTDDRLGGAPVAGAGISVALKDIDGNVVSAGNSATDGAGEAPLALTAAAPNGQYTIESSFGGTSYYTGASNAVPFTIDLRPSVLSFTSAGSVYRQDAIDVSAVLTDLGSAAPVADAPVHVAISQDGNTLEAFDLVSDANGAVSTPVSALPAGVYDVTASYGGTDVQGAITSTSTLTVLLRPVTLTIESVEGDTHSGESKPLQIKATDDLRGDGVAGHELVVKLVGAEGTIVELPATTGDDGTVAIDLPTDVPAGTYGIEVTSAETVDYVSSAALSSVEVLLRPTTLDSTTAATGIHGDAGALSAVLTDVRAAAGIEGQSIEFSVDGVGVGSALTDGTGTATLPYDLSADTGTYAIDAAFAGTDRLAAAAATTDSLEILPRATTLVYDGATSGIRGSTVTLSATFTDSALGSGLSGRTVHFSLGSFAADAITDANGVASVDVVLDQAPGEYTAEVSVDPETNFLGASTAAPFILNWEHTFDSALGNGTIHLNPSTKEFQFVSGDEDSGILSDPGMIIQVTPLGELVVMAYQGSGINVVGQFNLIEGAFTALVTTSGLPIALAGV
ncbi:MAG TPA: Ig-like domain-containing protein [Acidimicrobiales bacterium]|nr:Ig-like domain-containing protein [Acidimicrobiales bacterium]